VPPVPLFNGEESAKKVGREESPKNIAIDNELTPLLDGFSPGLIRTCFTQQSHEPKVVWPWTTKEHELSDWLLFSSAKDPLIWVNATTSEPIETGQLKQTEFIDHTFSLFAENECKSQTFSRFGLLLKIARKPISCAPQLMDLRWRLAKTRDDGQPLFTRLFKSGDISLPVDYIPTMNPAADQEQDVLVIDKRCLSSINWTSLIDAIRTQRTSANAKVVHTSDGKSSPKLPVDYLIDLPEEQKALFRKYLYFTDDPPSYKVKSFLSPTVLPSGIKGGLRLNIEWAYVII